MPQIIAQVDSNLEHVERFTYISRIWEFETITEITIFPISSTFLTISIFTRLLEFYDIFYISGIFDSEAAKVSEEIEDAGIVPNSHILDNTQDSQTGFSSRCVVTG